MHRLKGAKALLFDAVEEVTNLVERTRGGVASGSFGSPSHAEQTASVTRTTSTPQDATAGAAYETIRNVIRGVERVVDIGFTIQDSVFSNAGADKAQLRAGGQPDAAGNETPLIDLAESALNALYGDYLHRRRNALDLGMSFYMHGRPLGVKREILKSSIPNSTGKIVIFIHGLGCTERVWSISSQAFYGRTGVNFGSMLENELGYTPLHVRYNSGRHVSENGQLLSALLTQLVGEYPVEVEQIVLVGHSMGGLVARSAAYYGDTDNEPWIRHLSDVFCVASPNLGAPLEKGTNILSSLLGAIGTTGTQIPATILNARSAGIKDLRFGYTIDEEWSGKNCDSLLEDNRHDVPLIDGVGYYFVAATVTRNPEHPMGILLGDLLVRPQSAAGHAPEPTRRIPFRTGQILTGMNHLHMANHPAVYELIKRIL